MRVMKLKTVQKIVKEVLPKIEAHYGWSKHYDEPPYIIYDHSIYDTKVLKKTKKEETMGEFIFQDNEIIIYYPQMKSRKDVVQTLVHEYQHYLQSPSWFTRYYSMGYKYNDHPYEVQAFTEEENYKLFM
jgi:hypothetical protein